jgi:protein SCO1/2
VGALAALDFYGQVPDFSLIERSGRTVALADLRGKVWIVNFAYTQCTETCPTQTAQMARLQADLAGEKDVRLVSITVNPEEDTPERLAEYAEGYGADPERWFFLTGPQAAIYRLAIEGFHLGVVEVPPEEVHVHADGTQHVHAVPVGQQFIHSSRFVLVDRQGQIRGYYHGTDPEALQRLRQAVKTVLREKNP